MVSSSYLSVRFPLFDNLQASLNAAWIRHTAIRRFYSMPRSSQLGDSISRLYPQHRSRLPPWSRNWDFHSAYRHAWLYWAQSDQSPEMIEKAAKLAVTRIFWSISIPAGFVGNWWYIKSITARDAEAWMSDQEGEMHLPEYSHRQDAWVGRLSKVGYVWRWYTARVSTGISANTC